jgi:hypothetical protein
MGPIIVTLDANNPAASKLIIAAALNTTEPTVSMMATE